MNYQIYRIKRRLMRDLERCFILKRFKDIHLLDEKVKNNFNLYPNLEKISISNADDICNKRFNLLGFKGSTQDWAKDPITGFVWPKKRIKSLGDKELKLIWEFSRLQYLSILGVAYRKTKNIKYLQSFEEIVYDWQKKNPFDIGINWNSAMEVAIRAINLILAYNYFLEDLDKEFKTVFYKLLYQHMIYIKNHLEYSKNRNNHYITDLAGLFALAILYDKKRWIEFCKKELEKEIIHQTNQDGTTFEDSVAYHKFVYEVFDFCVLIGLRNGIKFSEAYKNRLEAMLDFIRYITKPSGKVPLIGDNDNSKLTYFSEKLIANLKLESKIFPYGGYYIFRTKRDYLVIKCGGKKGGHSHCDELSFELNDIIVDPGCYTYKRDKVMRNLFRSTEYHNTLKLDDEEQNDFSKAPFYMNNNSKGRVLVCKLGEKKDLFLGEHYGFKNVIHRREIIFDKIKREISLKDYLIDKEDKRHDIKINFHLNKNIKINKLIKNKFVVGNRYIITFPIKPKLIKGWISPNYGVKEEAIILSCSLKATKKKKFLIRIKINETGNK